MTGTRLSPLESGTGLVFNDGSQQPIFFLQVWTMKLCMLYIMVHIGTFSSFKNIFDQGVLTKVAGEAEGCAAHDTFTSVSVFLDWVNKVHDELAESQKVTEVVTNPVSEKLVASSIEIIKYILCLRIVPTALPTNESPTHKQY